MTYKLEGTKYVFNPGRYDLDAQPYIFQVEKYSMFGSKYIFKLGDILDKLEFSRYITSSKKSI